MSETEDEMQPGRWWRVLAPDGSIWCETSDEAQAREYARPSDRLERLWTITHYEWRECHVSDETEGVQVVLWGGPEDGQPIFLPRSVVERGTFRMPAEEPRLWTEADGPPTSLQPVETWEIVRKPGDPCLYARRAS